MTPAMAADYGDRPRVRRKTNQFTALTMRTLPMAAIAPFAPKSWFHHHTTLLIAPTRTGTAVRNRACVRHARVRS